MSNTVAPEQRRAIVRIRTTQQGQSAWGTGFVVGPGLVLTAYHVVADRSAAPEAHPAPFAGPNTVEFHGGPVIQGFEIVPDGWNREADWALVRCEVPEDVRPLPLSTVGPDDEEWYTHGFPRMQDVDGMKLDGTIDNESAELQGVPALQIFCRQMAAGQGGLAGGASGSPVLVDGRVVGLLRFSLSDTAGLSRAGTLYACPAAALKGQSDVVVTEATGAVLAGMTQEELDRVAKACGVVRLPNGWVTGYLVAPDWVATWSRDLQAVGEGSRLKVELGGAARDATLMVVDVELGCGLLRLDAPLEGVDPIPLARCDAANATWIAHGFPISSNGFPSTPFGLVQALERKRAGGGPGFLEIHSSEFSPDAPSPPLDGMEGAPVVVKGAVVGHLWSYAPFRCAHATRAEHVAALLDRATAGGTAADQLGAVTDDGPSVETLVLPDVAPGQYHAIVCHHGEDRVWARALGQRLEGAGFRIRFEDFQVGDGPDEVAALMEQLPSALSAVVLVSRAWLGSELGPVVDGHLLDLQEQGGGFRVVPAFIGEAPAPERWKDRVGIRFDGDPVGRSLERLEHALIGASTPRAGTAAAAALHARTRPADDLIRMVRSAENAAPETGSGKTDAEVQAAEAGGVLRVWDLWQAWLASGVADASAPLTVAESLIRLAHPKRALEVLGHAGDGTRATQLRALALSQFDEKLDDAIQLLERLRAEGQTDVETTSLLAGRLKQRWRASDNRNDLQAAHALYLEAFRRTEDYYPGINAAFTALGLGSTDLALELAAKVRDLLTKRPKDELDDWAKASLGEAYLILGNESESRTCYGEFIADRPNATRDLVSMRRQIREDLTWLGKQPDALDDLFFIPRVVAFTGHLTDPPDRPVPRFPEDEVPRVRELIRAQLKALHVGVGYCSGARGADMLFIEELLAKNGEVNVILPFPKEAFAETSVGPDWIDDFEALLEREGVEVTVLLDSDPGDEAGRNEAYAKCNREIMERARARAVQRDQTPMLIHVWDGKPGAARGGTAGFVKAWRKQGWDEAHIPVEST